MIDSTVDEMESGATVTNLTASEENKDGKNETDGENSSSLSQTQVSEIIKGKRAITDETDAALSKYFGLSRGYWRRMQVSYEQRKKARQLRMIEEKVTPYAELHPRNNHPELAGC